jgi:hypothetical protein
MMTLHDYLRELAFPATSTTTLIALVTFVILIGLALVAGLLGLWLAVATIPALLRYMTMIAEARSIGADTAAPGIEYFTIVGQFWTLFPVVPVVALAYVIAGLRETLGAPETTMIAIGAAALLPAHIGVLVLTHSPLQSLNPRAIVGYVRRTGASYWYGSATVMLVIVAPLFLRQLSIAALVIVEVYLVAACFAVIGGVTRGGQLVEQVDVPDAAEPDVEKVLAADILARTQVLNHAYGFASRGNRDGALNHVYGWLAQDPDPDAAWPWFLDQMLLWNDTYPGLLLAQQYLGRLLAHGNQVAAVKLMLRCRMLNPRFRPLSPDIPAAIAAAKACNNDDLLGALSD